VDELFNKVRCKKCFPFWFRRDLRLEDNIGLFHALKSPYPVIPILFFDEAILNKLPKNDARVGFIHENLSKINAQLEN
jgi:deoxyribodipyrimidine photo-lyase